MKLEELNVNGPIEQNVFGKSGVYECLHIQKKSMSLRDYREKTVCFDRLTAARQSEEVETMVVRGLCSFGRASCFRRHSTGQIW
jgi:[histone H3]-trimethyl-L-lysine9/36 demethylase